MNAQAEKGIFTHIASTFTMQASRKINIVNNSGYHMRFSIPGASNIYLASGGTGVFNPSVGVTYNGLSQGGTVDFPGTIPGAAITWFRYNYPALDVGGQTVEAFNFDNTVTYQAAPYLVSHIFSPATITIGPGGVHTFIDPAAESQAPPPPPPPAPLAGWEGERISMPLFVEGTGDMVLGVGGVNYTFPVDSEGFDNGGLAFVDFVVPANWDGMVTVNGVPVAVAPRIAYTGSPSMEYYANPYQDVNEALPPGMTWGVLRPPVGVTDNEHYGLPAGMTAGNKLPLPSGVTAISSGSVVGGSLPTGVHRDDGSSKWQFDDLQAFNANRTTSSSATNGGSTTSAGITSGTTPVTSGGSNAGLDGDALDAAVDAGSVGGFGSGGESVTPGAEVAGIGTSWVALKTQIDNKLGGFSPLAQGAIPTQSTLTMSLPFPGSLGGTKTVSIDLTQSPFPLARTLGLVVVIFSAGVFWMRWIKV